MNPVLRTFHLLLDELEARQIPYMVMGGWAVQVWGRPRPTYDVDFTLSLSREELRAFLGLLARKGWIVDEAFLKGFEDNLAGFAKVQVSVFEMPDPIRVDFFLARSDYQRTAFARRRQVLLLGRTCWVISPEDLILHKMVAGRHKDLSAVEEIVSVNSEPGKLELDYLFEWARRLSVGDALSKLLERFKLA